MMPPSSGSGYALVAPAFHRQHVLRWIKLSVVIGALSALVFVLGGAVWRAQPVRSRGVKRQGTSEFMLLDAWQQNQSQPSSAADSNLEMFPSQPPTGSSQQIVTLTLPTGLAQDVGAPVATPSIAPLQQTTLTAAQIADHQPWGTLSPSGPSIQPMASLSTQKLNTDSHATSGTEKPSSMKSDIVADTSTTQDWPPKPRLSGTMLHPDELAAQNDTVDDDAFSTSDAPRTTLPVEEPCQMAQMGSSCYQHVLWVLKQGIQEHPGWYANLNKTSSFEQVQAHLHVFDKNASCPRPCPCHTAHVGEKCYNHSRWVLAHGISSNPSNYQGLSTASRFEDVQDFLHRTEPDVKCDQPCSPPIFITTALFCFLVMQLHGYEPGLVRSQFARTSGIFACDGYDVFSIGGTVSFDTGPHGHQTESHAIEQAHDGTGSWGSWLNTLTFMHAWEFLIQDGRYSNYDWVVKADPDAVFLPERLRERLKPHTSSNGGNLYVQNCNQPNHIAVQGSLEVFSRDAIHGYGDNHERCKSQLDWHSMGEDFFMQKCMEMMGVTPVQEFYIMSDVNCQQVSCNDRSRVSYHPFKGVNDWWNCWNTTTGSR